MEGGRIGAQPLVALALLVTGAVGYPLAWASDAYVFAFLVIGLAPLQIISALVGIVGRSVRRHAGSRGIRAAAWALDAASIASAATGFVFLRSIRWA